MTLSQLSQRLSGRMAYGDPITTEHGSTILPVSRVRRGGSSAVGIFMINDSGATWVPAVDADRIAHIGVATGFVSATLACLAVLRQPPWPITTIRVTKRVGK